jgi:hypothetical protein
LEELMYSTLPVCCGIAIAVAAFVAPLRAQGTADSVGVEVAAARAMRTHQYVKGALAIDPGVAPSGQAPGLPVSGRERSPARANTIAKAVGASLLSAARLLQCRSGTRCSMTGAAALLVLSLPRFTDGEATITATIWQNAPSERQPVDYRTMLLTLSRTSTGWVVTNEKELGVS